ncbi:MAG: tRNA pseudouridine(55) synthase TruB [Porphyromonas sp.]|nr:tRNA pseudouridine(55) synthase TruB [Porphyromonas sp.]
MQENATEYFKAGQIIAIDKPLKWTSFDVVNKCRWMLCKTLGVKKLKVGHAGTLDPLASGVVVLCIGKSTKDIEKIQLQKKVYRATIKFGETTPSFDLESEVDATYPWEHITKEMVDGVLPRFVGSVMQVPPVFSACKVEGKRAYELARKGKDVELEPKRIEIYNISVLNFNPPYLKLEIGCGKGTYIRSLARDLGEALDSGAHLTELIRLSVGEYTLDNALKIEEFSNYIENTIKNIQQ